MSNKSTTGKKSHSAEEVGCEQSSFFPQITRAKAPTKLCKLEKRKAFLSGCGFLVRSINRALCSIYRALQKLGKERDCSQSTEEVKLIILDFFFFFVLQKLRAGLRLFVILFV